MSERKRDGCRRRKEAHVLVFEAVLLGGALRLPDHFGGPVVSMERRPAMHDECARRVRHHVVNLGAGARPVHAPEAHVLFEGQRSLKVTKSTKVQRTVPSWSARWRAARRARAPSPPRARSCAPS